MINWHTVKLRPRGAQSCTLPSWILAVKVKGQREMGCLFHFHNQLTYAVLSTASKSQFSTYAIFLSQKIRNSSEGQRSRSYVNSNLICIQVTSIYDNVAFILVQRDDAIITPASTAWLACRWYHILSICPCITWNVLHTLYKYMYIGGTSFECNTEILLFLDTNDKNTLHTVCNNKITTIT